MIVYFFTGCVDCKHNKMPSIIRLEGILLSDINNSIKELLLQLFGDEIHVITYRQRSIYFDNGTAYC